MTKLYVSKLILRYNYYILLFSHFWQSFFKISCILGLFETCCSDYFSKFNMAPRVFHVLAMWGHLSMMSSCECGFFSLSTFAFNFHLNYYCMWDEWYCDNDKMFSCSRNDISYIFSYWHYNCIYQLITSLNIHKSNFSHFNHFIQ